MIPANDWNGNGKSDAFDSYMDMKVGGKIYGNTNPDTSRGNSGGITLNPLKKIIETEDNLQDDTRVGLALFASFIFSIVIAMGGVLIAQNVENVVSKVLAIVFGIVFGGLFFYGMIRASDNS